MRRDYGVAACVDCNHYMTCCNIPVFTFSLKCGKIFEDETSTKTYNILRFRQVEISPDTFSS